MYKFGDKVQFKDPKGYMSASRRKVLGQTGIVIAVAFNGVLSVCFEANDEGSEGFQYSIEFCQEMEIDSVA